MRGAVQMDVQRALMAVALAAATLMAGGLGAHVQPSARWLIIVDDLHVDFRNTGQLRTLLTMIGKELIRDGDQVALCSTSPKSVSVTWTYDRKAVDSVAKKIAGNGLRVSDILAIRQDLTASNEVDYRATVALSRLNEIITAVAAGVDRRIGIIYISNGYVDPWPSLISVGTSVGTSAGTRVGGRTRIPIFALAPRLLPDAIDDSKRVEPAQWNAYWAATRNSLVALSESSGGFALAEGQDVAEMLAQISDLVRR